VGGDSWGDKSSKWALVKGLGKKAAGQNSHQGKTPLHPKALTILREAGGLKSGKSKTLDEQGKQEATGQSEK